MIIAAAVVTAVVMAAAGWIQQWRAGRLIPDHLREAVPESCRQLIVVRAHGVDSVPAEVWLLERPQTGGRWRVAAGPMEAVVGRNGVGWGQGEPVLANPGGYPAKQEGDGRSPAGIFPLPFAFGTTPVAPGAGTRMPWQECTPTLRGVDDVKSRYYNQVVDEAAIPDKDWDSAEIMRREDGAYDTGLVIGHNAGRVPGGGSCIFLHRWKGPGEGTAGCTALAAENVTIILEWLNPVLGPRLVMGVTGP